MAEYNSIKSLLQGVSNASQLRAIIFNMLRKEADYMEKFLNNEIANYYAAREPDYYRRTGRFKNSVIVSNPQEEADGSYSISVHFDEGLATHPSIIGPKHADGFVPILLNEGWSWKGKSVNIYRFTHFDGVHFIETAVKKYYEARGENALQAFKVIKYNGKDSKPIKIPK